MEKAKNEAKKALEKFQQRLDMYALRIFNAELFENLPIPAVIIDSEGVFVSVNNRACSILEYKKHEMIGKNYLEFLDKDYRSVTEKMRRTHLKRLLIGEKMELGDNQFVKNIYVTKSGKKVTLYWYADQEYKLDDLYIGLFVTNLEFRDPTDDE